jgi:dienelactone hydrolase
MALEALTIELWELDWEMRRAVDRHLRRMRHEVGKPRGVTSNCGGFGEQAGDGYAALHYLAHQTFVKADRVALMGFSMGGSSTLASLEQGSLGGRFPDKFRAGIAFYPLCLAFSGLMTVPALILIGDQDYWTPAQDCADMVAGKTMLGPVRPPGNRSNVKLVVYPGAHHAFDVVDLSLVPGGMTMFGHRVEYNEAATKDSLLQVSDFLQRELNQ